MKVSRFHIVSSACVLVFAMGMNLTAPLAQDNPEDQFELLFGDKYREVTTSRVDADNIELAGEMVEVLSYDDIDDKFKKLIAQKIIEMAPADDERSWDTLENTTEWMSESDPKTQAQGLEIESEILKAKIVKTPRAQRAVAYEDFYNKTIAAAMAYEKALDTEKAFELYRKGSAASRYVPREYRDLARDGMKRIVALRAVKNKVESLKAKFLDAPSEALAAEIATIYIVDLNAPEEAVAFAKASKNADLMAITKVTGTDVEDMDPEDAYKAGMAYATLSASAADTSKANPLSQAVSFLDLYLEKDESKGLQRVRATTTRNRLAEELEKLGGSKSSLPSRSVDVTKFLVSNWKDFSSEFMSDKNSQAWKLDGSTFNIHWGNKDGGWGPMLHFPVKISGDYEIAMKWKPGNRGAIITLPVDDQTIYLRYAVTKPIGEAGNTEKANRGNDLKRLVVHAASEPGKEHTTLIKVKYKGQALAVQVLVDGKEALTFEGLLKNMASPYMKYGPQSKMGVSPMRHSGNMSLSSIKVTGKAKISPPEIKGK